MGIWLDLVRVPPSGTWEGRRADLYASAADWLEPTEVTRKEGLELLVRRYLGGFGPAPAADIANWVGLPVSSLAPTLERLSLRRFRDEGGRELLDLPRAPLPDPDTPAPVRFLPTWDATLLVHARRTGILPEEHRPKVFSTKTPHSWGRSSSTERWREPAGTRAAAYGPSPSIGSTRRRGASSSRRPSAWRRFTLE